eukprot:ctg_726.g385
MGNGRACSTCAHVPGCESCTLDCTGTAVSAWGTLGGVVHGRPGVIASAPSKTPLLDWSESRSRCHRRLGRAEHWMSPLGGCAFVHGWSTRGARRRVSGRWLGRVRVSDRAEGVSAGGSRAAGHARCIQVGRHARGVAAHLPWTYEDDEVVYIESGMYSLHLHYDKNPIELHAGDLIQFPAGLSGSVLTRRKVCRRFLFCSPDEWNARFADAVLALAPELAERARQARSSLGDAASMAASADAAAGIRPADCNGIADEALSREVRMALELERARHIKDKQRLRRRYEPAFPTWVAQLIGDFLQFGAAWTLYKFWYTGPGKVIPFQVVNFALHDVVVPLGMGSVLVAATLRLLVAYDPSIRDRLPSFMVLEQEEFHPRQAPTKDGDGGDADIGELER